MDRLILIDDSILNNIKTFKIKLGNIMEKNNYIKKSINKDKHVPGMLSINTKHKWLKRSKPNDYADMHDVQLPGVLKINTKHKWLKSKKNANEAIENRGSQRREKIEDTDYKLVEKNSEDNTVVLQDSDGKKELWVKNDDFAGYCIDIDGVGYEFVTTLNEAANSSSITGKPNVLGAKNDARHMKKRNNHLVPQKNCKNKLCTECPPNKGAIKIPLTAIEKWNVNIY